MAVVGEAADLERQVDAAGIGDVDAGETALLGDRLSPHVFLEGYWEISTCCIAIFVRKDHAVLALDDADPGDHAAPGDVPPLLLFIGRPAVELFLADLVPGVEAQLEKFAPRIDQESDELAHRLLPLLGEPLHLGCAADIVGLLAVLEQERILLLPVFQIGRPLLLLPLGPRQPRFRLFSHLLFPPSCVLRPV